MEWGGSSTLTILSGVSGTGNLVGVGARRSGFGFYAVRVGLVGSGSAVGAGLSTVSVVAAADLIAVLGAAGCAPGEQADAGSDRQEGTGTASGETADVAEQILGVLVLEGGSKRINGAGDIAEQTGYVVGFGLLALGNGVDLVTDGARGRSESLLLRANVALQIVLELAQEVLGLVCGFVLGGTAATAAGSFTFFAAFDSVVILGGRIRRPRS